MIIVLLDEPTLFIYPSREVAERSVEPIDAEEGLRMVFDHEAVPYRIEWLRPNRHRRTLFGLLVSIEPGEYRFVPSGPPDPAGLLRLLESHSSCEPSDAVAELSRLAHILRTA